MRLGYLVVLLSVGLLSYADEQQQPAVEEETSYKEVFDILGKGTCQGSSRLACREAALLVMRVCQGASVLAGAPDEYCVQARKPIVEGTDIQDDQLREFMALVFVKYRALGAKLATELQVMDKEAQQAQ